jgi:hypothetical protein
MANVSKSRLPDEEEEGRNMVVARRIEADTPPPATATELLLPAQALLDCRLFLFEVPEKILRNT